MATKLDPNKKKKQSRPEGGRMTDLALTLRNTWLGENRKVAKEIAEDPEKVNRINVLAQSIVDEFSSCATELAVLDLEGEEE